MRTLVFQGDSITDAGRIRDEKAPNSNKALGQGYAFLCAASLLAGHPGDGWEIFNRGISANRVLDLYARWKLDTIKLNPDVVSILIGVNDSWHEFLSGNGVDLQRYEKTYRELLDWTLEMRPHCTLILCEPFCLGETPWSDDLRERGSVVARLSKQYGATFVPFQKMFDQACSEAAPDYWLPDGVHPSPAGHLRMAELWLELSGFNKAPREPVPARPVTDSI